MQKQDNSQSNSVYRFILILVFIIFVFLLFFLYQTRKKAGQQKNSETIVPTQTVTNLGSFSFQLTSGLDGPAEGKLNEIISLEVMAASEQKSIVGYDVIVSFSPDEAEIVSAESLLPDFKLYQTKNSDHYILTGTKIPESKESTVLVNDPILRLQVKPKKIGEITISLVDKIGLEKSQMVDEQTKILSPEVGELTLSVN